MPLSHNAIYQDIAIDIAMTAAERKSDFKLTTNTPYLPLMGELWAVYSMDLGENSPCYNDTTLCYDKLSLQYSEQAT